LASAKTQAQINTTGTSSVAYGKISCVVVSPIGITKVKDMNFGIIISGNEGSIVLSPNGDSPTTTGGVSLNLVSGAVSAASFEVTDGMWNISGTQKFYTGYSITLPSQDITMVNELGKTMRVSNFTSSPSASGYGTITNGKGILTVGATLYVNSMQEVGNYISSSPFPVTVNYY
jgi:hypothetical protein